MTKSIYLYRPAAALLLLCFSTASVGAFAQSSAPGTTAAPNAQSSSQPVNNQNQQINVQQNNAQQINGTTVDPAAGPQSPVPVTTSATTTIPEAPAPNTAAPAQRQTLPLPSAQAPDQTNTQPQQPPAGAATAEKGVTRGGVASRPAGVAIAPAKQRQMRSLLIKTGAIVFGAVAIGTIYALHRSTSSYPPGSGH